jgi:hypothetical protein
MSPNPEVLQGTQVEIDAHRWYVVLRITLPDGTAAERCIADPDRSGLVVYDSYEQYEAAVA